MKFSLSRFTEGFLKAVKVLFKRFPVTTILIFIEFILFVVLIENGSLDEQQKYMIGMGLLSNLGLILSSITVQLFSERFGVFAIKKALLNIVVLLIVGSLSYLFLYADVASYELITGDFTGNTYRLLILVFITLLSVFSLPFIRDTTTKEWWNFFITTVFRASVSMLYAVALYIGLSLALFAIDSFWNFTFWDNQYALVAAFSFVLIAPLHFLHDLYEFTLSTVLVEIPKFLVVLVKYILSPLILVYTVILYPYIFSFPFRDAWPANESTGIILALHVMIYAGVVLFYGVAQGSAEEKFKRLYTKITAVISIPTLLFWIYSLYLRIDGYGMTVNRFAMMAIILWFLGVSVYLLASKVTNVKYIITSLILVLLAVFYLPFSSFYWGEKAQVDRMVRVAKEEGMLKDGKIERKDEPKIAGNDYTMNEITSYLIRYNRSEKLRDLWGDSVLERLEVNEYGYATEKPELDEYDGERYYRGISTYSYNTVYFDKVTGQAPSLTTYRTVLLDVNSVEIPEGYTKVDYIEPTFETTKGVTSVVLNTEFEIVVDINDDGYYRTPKNRVGSSTEKSPRDFSASPENFFTDDPSLLTFESEGKLFIATHIAGEFKEGKLESIGYLTGYLFTK